MLLWYNSCQFHGPKFEILALNMFSTFYIDTFVRQTHHLENFWLLQKHAPWESALIFNSYLLIVILRMWAGHSIHLMITSNNCYWSTKITCRKHKNTRSWLTQINPQDVHNMVNHPWLRRFTLSDVLYSGHAVHGQYV